MKSVTSLLSKLTTSSSSTFTSTAEKGEKSGKNGKSEKLASTPAQDITARSRPEKGEKAASRDIQGAAGKPGKHEIRETKKVRTSEAAKQAITAVLDEAERREIQYRTPIAKTSMGMTYGPFPSEQAAMSFFLQVGPQPVYAPQSQPQLSPQSSPRLQPQSVKPSSSLSSSRSTGKSTSVAKSTAAARTRGDTQLGDSDQEMLKRIRRLCKDTVGVDMTRHMLTVKEIQRWCPGRSPAEVRASIATLEERGMILVDPKHPEYVFLPVPAEKKSKSSCSTTSSTSGLTSSSDSTSGSGGARMPAFFANMSSGEWQFYKRGSVAALLHLVTEARGFTSLDVKVIGDARHFSISKAVLEQATRNEDPGIGIHPYLIPEAVQMLQKEAVCQSQDPDVAELHFSGSAPQLCRLMRDYSYQS